MSNWIQIEDFSVGRNSVAFNNYSEINLQDYIDKVEKTTVYKLFGVEMGNELYANTNLYPELIAPFIEDINGNFTESDGLLEILKGFVNFYWYRDQLVKGVQGGIERVVPEKSNPNITHNDYDYATRYNNAVRSIKAIQYKCLSDTVTYDKFKGQEFKAILPF